MDRYVTVSEAAKIKNVTRQAIYLAIRENRLRAYKYNDAWRIFKTDLDEFDRLRFSRVKSTCKGELIFDESKGYISMNKASEMLGVPIQKLYYAARTGKLKAIRRNCSWVVYTADLLTYQEEYLNKKFPNKKFG